MKPLEDIKRSLTIPSFSVHRKRPKAGAAPGSLIYTGEVHTAKVEIEVIDYSADHITEVNVLDVSELAQYNHGDSVTWINVQGLHDVDLIAKIGEIMDLHDLTLEDIVDIAQRPKVEEFENPKDRCAASEYHHVKILRYLFSRATW
jgi:magnesium transporter